MTGERWAPSQTWRVPASMLSGSQRIAELEARAETAERALLKTWEVECNGVYSCGVCIGSERADPFKFKHTPDCLIPSLLERYEET